MLTRLQNSSKRRFGLDLYLADRFRAMRAPVCVCSLEELSFFSAEGADPETGCLAVPCIVLRSSGEKSQLLRLVGSLDMRTISFCSALQLDEGSLDRQRQAISQILFHSSE
eukprot:557679-Amphidinium_carterae.1